MPTPTLAQRRTLAAAALLTVLVAGGCSLAGATQSPQPLPPPRIDDGVTVNSDPMHAQAVPASGPVEQGVLYRFDLFSHCGTVYWLAWDFDGSFWDPVGSTGDASFGYPTEGFTIPVDHGTIELTDTDRARFTSSGGVIVELQRSPDQQREGMLCI